MAGKIPKMMRKSNKLPSPANISYMGESISGLKKRLGSIKKQQDSYRLRIEHSKESHKRPVWKTQIFRLEELRSELEYEIRRRKNKKAGRLEHEATMRRKAREKNSESINKLRRRKNGKKKNP